MTLTTDYDFPFQVTIQLNNVGGPSAGMMFALGIMDVLTPGELNGGENVAGTGTITSDGTVGPIGGIRQKMWGAKDAGAEWFLAPKSNCDEVVGSHPGAPPVFSVETLDDSLKVLETIRDNGDLDALPDVQGHLSRFAEGAEPIEFPSGRWAIAQNSPPRMEGTLDLRPAGHTVPS